MHGTANLSQSRGRREPGSVNLTAVLTRKEVAVKLLWALQYFCPVQNQHKPAAGLRICTLTLDTVPALRGNYSRDSAHPIEISESHFKNEITQAIAGSSARLPCKLAK